ncbi:MAG: hypothetical protein J1F67_12030 [Muribaculaceae bacterium]|nr:hypothetical protein [Muribaculaceae bacterium]
MGKYDDIINLPHHVSDYHKPMPMANRAAQFAPFAALSGYEDAIYETSRLTEAFKELSDDEKNLLSRKLNYAIENLSLTEITYFVPDNTKAGGSYKSVTGRIKKWDEYDNTLVLRDGKIIRIDLISEINIKDSNIEF